MARTTAATPRCARSVLHDCDRANRKNMLRLASTGRDPSPAQRRPAADRSFERLYQKHVHAVYRYALAVLHNEADAEDVTQTTFLSAYRAFAARRAPAQAAQLADQDRAQRLPPALPRLVAPPAGGRVRRDLGRSDARRRRRPDRRRDPPRARLPRLQPARRARHARARRTLLRRDRRRSSTPPSAPSRPCSSARAARSASSSKAASPASEAELTLSPRLERQDRPSAERGRAPRPPARMQGLRRARAPPARPARRPQAPRRRPAACLARHVPRRWSRRAAVAARRHRPRREDGDGRSPPASSSPAVGHETVKAVATDRPTSAAKRAGVQAMPSGPTSTKARQRPSSQRRRRGTLAARPRTRRRTRPLAHRPRRGP